MLDLHEWIWIKVTKRGKRLSTEKQGRQKGSTKQSYSFKWHMTHTHTHTELTRRQLYHYCGTEQSAGCVSAGEHVWMTGWLLDTKSPKIALTFCNRVTIETWLLLHPGGVGVSRKRVSRWVWGVVGGKLEGIGGDGGEMHNEQCCSKNWKRVGCKGGGVLCNT